MEYRVLGPMEVRDGQGSIPLAGEKQRALLALLLLSANHVVSRERLIDELWGDEPPETAVTSVQVYVSRLRKLLPPDTLVTRPPGYLIAADPEQVDVHRFERLIGEGRAALAGNDPGRAARLLREALALWRGPPLAEFAIEPFARLEGGRLEELRLAALEDRLQADLATGDGAALVGELEGLIAAYPHRERLRGQLMLALYRSGRQAEALEAYREARTALDALGLEPSDGLRELEHSILVQDAALATPRPLLTPTISLPGPLRAASPFPFVGRSEELDMLRSLLALAERDEGGQVALVAAEAGGGKTRLARELASEAVARGTLVLYGAANADVSVPYEPFVEALEFLARTAEPAAFKELVGADGDELARLLPSLGPAPPPAADPDTARHRLHGAVATLLARVSRQRPLVVIVDDIQWADAPSLQLLRHVTHAAFEARVLVVVTYRDRTEDPRPELSAALADLSRLEGVTRVRLGALADEAISEFIERAAGADAGEVAESIGRLTEGTPFLLCELWRALVDTDSVEVSAGAVRLTRSLDELSSPERVRDVVHYRLSRLAPATTAVLELAAAAGTEFELSLLGDEGSVVAAADEAVESGMIEPLGEPVLSHRFTHELVRRALYDRLTSARRAELHLRIGEALERRHGANLDRFVAELAHHYTLASPVAGVERAVDYNIRAAEAAARVLAYQEAAKQLRTALDLGVDDPVQQARAELELGNALYFSGRLDEAEPMLARAIADAARAEEHGLRAYASLVRHHVRLRNDRAAALPETRGVAEDAIEAFTRVDDHGGLAQAWRLLSFVHIGECRWGEAHEALERALAHALDTADRRECPKIVTWLLSALYFGPTPAPEALRRVDELQGLCGDDAYIDALAACIRSGLLAMVGRFDEARAAGSRGLAGFDAAGLVVTAGHARAYVADAHLLAGDGAAAERELLAAHDLLASAGDAAGALSIGCQLAWTLGIQGRYADAEPWVLKSRGALDGTDVMTRIAGIGGEAAVAAGAGNLTEAARLAQEVIELAAETDAPNIRAGALVLQSQLLALAGRTREAAGARDSAITLYEAKGNVSAAAQARDATPLPSSA